MERCHAEHQSLLNWMTNENQYQIGWIVDYLYKKNMQAFLGDFFTLDGSNQTLIKIFEKELSNAEFREIIRKMRAAWHQQSYRKKKGKQVSFQLPERTVSELEKIAKDRSQSRTQTLRQIIHDAANQNQRLNKQSKKKIETLQKNLKALSAEKAAAEKIRNRIINTLSEKLAEEVMLRILYEEAMGPINKEELEEFKNEKFNETLRKRIEEIVESISDIRLLKNGIEPIKAHLSTTQALLEDKTHSDGKSNV